MTSRVVYSRRAAAEVEEITASLAEHGQVTVDRVSLALGHAEQQLSQSPNSGGPGLLPGTRRLVLGNYIVSYRRRGSDVEIFAVRHAHRRNARPLTSR
jgi:plasmid stabilization system protein ParE